MRKTPAAKAKRSEDSYLELVQRCPLKTIKNEAEHDAATGIIADLMGRALDAGAGDYLDAMIVLVTQYEDEHHGVVVDMTPQEAVRALMQANGLTQADIGRVIGSESAVSMFLNGDRSLSKAQIKRLAERFKIDASALIG